MIERSGHIEPYPADSQTDIAQMREQQLSRRKSKREKLVQYCKRGMGAAALAGTVGLSYLAGDIHEGREKVADTHPSLHFVYEGENPAHDDVATIVATGLGTRDPTETAKKLTAHRQVGDVYALEYSNKDINIDELTATVVEMARANNIKTLIFDGYSIGGPIQLAIAARIYQDEPDLQVSDIILNSSPIGDQGISSESQASADRLSFFINIYPDLVYSEDLRFVVEMVSRSQWYWDYQELDFDLQEFIKSARSVKREKIEDEKAASGSLIAAQFMFWEKFGVEDNIEILSQEIEDKHEPRIFYTRARNPGDDTIVNLDRSRDNLQELAKRYNLNSKVIYIDNIGHANPGDRPVEYNQAFLDQILPSIKLDEDEASQLDNLAPLPADLDLVSDTLAITGSTESNNEDVDVGG